MNVLMVTRETEADRRYGLGRSLAPLLTALEAYGYRTGYLSQVDLAPKDLAQRKKWLRRFELLLGMRQRNNQRLLLGAIAERIHMGRFAARIAVRERYRNIHFHDPWIAAGFCLKPPCGIRWGVTEHGFGSYSRATLEDGLPQGAWAQRLLRWMEGAVLARANWVVAPTAAALDQLARDLCLPGLPSHWHVISHARPNLPGYDREHARMNLGWKPAEFHVLGVGRLVALKRFDLLVQACAVLFAKAPGVHLHLLGQGDHAPLLELARQRGFAEHLHFAVVDDVGLWLAAADLYVSTSATESFGLANLEALAAGTPSVCTAVGGVPEVVGDGAWLIPLDLTVLTRVLESLFEDSSARAALACRARARVAAWPDIASIACTYADLYR